jgi:hypothetical protein
MSLIVGPKDQETDEEREDWTLLSMNALERAYGDDEPEYSLDLIKESAIKPVRRKKFLRDLSDTR